MILPDLMHLIPATSGQAISSAIVCMELRNLSTHQLTSGTEMSLFHHQIMASPHGYFYSAAFGSTAWYGVSHSAFALSLQ